MLRKILLLSTVVWILMPAFIVDAQKIEAPKPVPPPPIAVGSGNGIGSGYGYSEEDTDDTKITGATVRGRVVYEDSGRPLRYAMVGLVKDDVPGAEFNSKFVKTDENGEFLMKNVKEGNYTPFVKSEGILPPDFNAARNDGETAPTAEKIAVVGLGEIQIVVRARRGAAISGRIVYADGEPAAGIRIEILRKVGETSQSPNFGGNGNNGKTNDRGEYRLSGLSAGTYYVRAVEPVSNVRSRSVYAYSGDQNTGSILRTYFPEGENSARAQPLELVAGQEQTAIDINLPERKLYAVSGRVIDKNNRQPLERFDLSLKRIFEADDNILNAGSPSVSTISKKSGAWEYSSLPKGKYQLTVSQSYRRSPKPDEPKPLEYALVVKNFEIGANDIANLDIEMPSPSVISGTIVAETGDLSASQLLFYAANLSDENSILPAEITAEDKSAAAKKMNFRIGRLAGGKYRLFMPMRGFYIKSVTSGGREQTDAPLEIGENETLDNVQIVVSNAVGTLKGKVSGYRKGERTAVVAYQSGAKFEDLRFAKVNGGNVNENGEYEIKLPPGDYSVTIWTEKNRPNTEAQAKKWFAEQLKNSTTVTIKAGETRMLDQSVSN